MPLGDSALLLELGNQPDEKTNQAVHFLAASLAAKPFAGWLESVPAFCSLAVFFDVEIVRRAYPDFENAAAAVRFLMEKMVADLPEISTQRIENQRVISIRVKYGGAFGPDLEEICRTKNLSENEFIALHTAPVYRVAMIGFLPGFPYLLGLDERLSMPRKDNPRLRVPPGSVAIGGSQTGIYPLESPGGWHLVGQTDFKLFDPSASRPTSLEPGDFIRFKAI